MQIGWKKSLETQIYTVCKSHIWPEGARMTKDIFYKRQTKESKSRYNSLRLWVKLNSQETKKSLHNNKLMHSRGKYNN